MRDLIIEGLRIIAPLSVALIVLAQAVEIAPSKVAAYFRDRPFVMLRALAAALVAVPAAALALILVLEPAPAVAVGLAILVACPPAPLMIKNARQIGRGDAAFVASLHLSLAALAIVTVPAVLNALAIPLGFRDQAGVDPVATLSLLAKTILIPIGVGLAVRAFFPAWGDRFGPRLGTVGSIALLVVIVALAVALFPALLSMDAWSYGVIAAVIVAALAIGHLLGPRNAAEKTILAVECAVRHPGLAVSIGATNFSSQQALAVLLPCALLSVVIGTAYLFWRGRSAAALPTAS